MKKKRFLFSLLMAIVMMAMSPQKVWALDQDTDGYYKIYNATDLKDFRTVVNGSNSAACAKLMNNITLSDTWTPIGVNGHTYSGTFLGRNFSISGLSMNVTGWEQGLFGWIEGATIKDLTVSGTMTSTTTNSSCRESIGGVVGMARGVNTITNVHSNVNITMNHNNFMGVGGVVGKVEYISGYSTITDCSYSGTLTLNSNIGRVGGIVGNVSNGGTVTNCSFTGTITTASGCESIGGIIGWIYNDHSAVSISNCTNTGAMTLGTGPEIGGIIGHSAGNLNILNNTFASGATINTATSSTACGFVGGITGKTDGTILIQQCTAAGSINVGESYDCIAGIVGYCNDNSKLTIKSCLYSGHISNTSTNSDINRVAGIIAYASDNGSNFGGIKGCLCCGSFSTPSSNTIKPGAIASALYNNALDRMTDNYYRSDMATAVVFHTSGGHSIPSSNYSRTADQIGSGQSNSGQVAYELYNGSIDGHTSWRQNITSGTVDANPVLDQTHNRVYNTYHNNCAGTRVHNYTNSSTSYTDAHSYTSQTVSDTYKKSDATCTASAVYYYSCSKCNANENNANHTFTNGSAIGHGSTGYTETYSWSGTCYNDASKDTKACSFTLKCNKCSTNVVNGSSLTCTKTAHTDATCLAAGKTTYSATGSYTSTNSSYNYSATKTHDYTIAASGHNIVNGSCSRCATEQSYLSPTYTTANTPKDGIASWATAKHLATPVSASSSTVTWVSGWYYVPANTTVKLDDGAVCSGDVHLILCDGATLTIAKKAASNSNSSMPGVKVNNGNSLTIYGQTNNSGTLSASGVSYTAGIGSQQSGTSGSITINGGTVSASGGTQAAGIGGSSAGIGQNITINGGNVTATGGYQGAGIGGGSSGKGSSIVINGGVIKATSGSQASAIGGGGNSSGSGSIFANKSIEIYKGTSLVNNTGQDLTSALRNSSTATSTVTMKPHVFDRMTKTAAYEMTAGTCKVKAVYYYNCSNCGTSEANPNHVEEGDLNPNNHKAVDAYDNLKTAATCTDDAIYYQKCEWCNAQLTTTCTQAKSALGHSLDHHDALTETCTTDGNKEYWQCSRCSGYFKDAEGKESYASKPTIAKHHTFTNYVYNNDVTCVKDGTKTASCDNGCGTTDTKDDPEYPATGNHEYTENSNGFCTGCGGYEPATPVYKADLTTVDYYAIGNAGQLYWFANQANTVNLGIHGKLTKDITVNDGTFDENGKFIKSGETVESTPVSWTPIGGGESSPYTGTFDGNNHPISGLYCSRPTRGYVGFFGCAKGATITDLGIIKSYFCGYLNVGAVCGSIYSTNANITNCFSADGFIRGSYNATTGEVIGGLVGLCGSGNPTISNCHSSCTVISDCEKTGGLCGWNIGTLTGCYVTGNVTTTNQYTGGLCGYNEGTLTSCYATGNVTSTSFRVGGICGYNVGGFIKRSWFSGNVSGAKADVAGICGELGSGTIENCFVTGNVIDISTTTRQCVTDYGGIVAWIEEGNVTNCYFTGNITCVNKTDNTLIGGICANTERAGSSISNCYTNYNTGVGKSKGSVTNVNANVPLSRFQSGEIAYLLNGSRNEDTDESPLVWGQVLEADATPILNGGGVDTYKRTNIKNKWGTLVVPFDVLGHQEEYDLYSIISVDDEELTLKRPEGILPAGTPVLIRMSEAGKDAETGKYNLHLEAANTALNTSGTLTSEIVEGLALKGSYDVKDITEVSGYIISNNAFWNIQSVKGENKVYNAPFRAYLEGSTSNCAAQLRIGTDDEEASSLMALKAINEGVAEYYDLNGRRISELRNGVNIVRCGDKSYKVILRVGVTSVQQPTTTRAAAPQPVVADEVLEPISIEEFEGQNCVWGE